VQITRDHSYVQSLIDEGRISPEEAESHPHRSVIMRVLSGKEEDTADVSVREARAGDRYLLCSDGLSGVVSHDTLAATLASGETPDETCDRLVALALRGGGPDNVSCIVADVVEIGGGRQPSTTPQVVGAAAFHRPRRSSAAGTPAARARALRGDADDAEDDDAGPDPVLAARERRRRRIRWTAFPLLLVLLLAAGGAAGWRWSQQQYFVGVAGERVSLYQGLTQDVGPIGTSHVVERTDIAVADLPTTWATQVEGRISADSRGAAESTIENLRVLAAECRAAVQVPATPSATPDAGATPVATAPVDPLAPTATPTAAPVPTTPVPSTTPGTTPSDDLTVEDCGGIG
jgi:protein phosphatase